MRSLTVFYDLLSSSFFSSSFESKGMTGRASGDMHYASSSLRLCKITILTYWVLLPFLPVFLFFLHHYPLSFLAAVVGDSTSLLYSFNFRNAFRYLLVLVIIHSLWLMSLPPCKVLVYLITLTGLRCYDLLTLAHSIYDSTEDYKAEIIQRTIP